MKPARQGNPFDVPELAEPRLRGPTVAPPGSKTVEAPALGAALWDLPLKEFGLARNPFSFEHVSSLPGLFTSHASRVLTSLRDWAGSSSRLEGGALLVGAEGAGKTLVLRALADGYGNEPGVGCATYFDAGISQVHRREGVDDAYRSRLLRDLAQEDRKELHVIDNADWMVGGEDTGGLRLSGGAPASTVLGVSYPVYLKAMRSGALAQGTRMYFLPPLPEHEIERKLRASVRACSEMGDPFQPDAYVQISSFSMGLPGLAAEVAHASLWTAGWVGAEQVTRFIVDKVAETLFYDAAAKLLAGRRQHYGSLELAREALRMFYVEGDVRRNDLFRAFSRVPNSTLNHHLQRLTAERILVEERYGHRVRYDIPRPVRAALQLLQGGEGSRPPRDSGEPSTKFFPRRSGVSGGILPL